MHANCSTSDKRLGRSLGTKLATSYIKTIIMAVSVPNLALYSCDCVVVDIYTTTKIQFHVREPHIGKSSVRASHS